MILFHNFQAKEIWEMNSDEKFEKAKSSKEKGVEFFKVNVNALLIYLLDNKRGMFLFVTLSFWFCQF